MPVPFPQFGLPYKPILTRKQQLQKINRALLNPFLEINRALLNQKNCQVPSFGDHFYTAEHVTYPIPSHVAASRQYVVSEVLLLSLLRGSQDVYSILPNTTP